LSSTLTRTITLILILTHYLTLTPTLTLIDNMRDYVRQLQRFNVGEDCPVFDGLFEFCQIYTSGSIGDDDDDDLLNYSLWEIAFSKEFYLITFLSSIQYGYVCFNQFITQHTLTTYSQIHRTLFYLLTHSLTYSVAHSLTQSLTRSLTHLHAHSLPHSLTHSLSIHNEPLTHSHD
jgi:hypothetical protein